jgi:replicative DNA helicase
MYAGGIQRRGDNDAPDMQLHNIEGEAALIGGLLVKNQAADVIADILAPEDFYEPIHGAIFSAIMDAVANGRSVSPVALIPQFANDARLQELGGTNYLAKLTGSTAALVVDMKAQAESIAELAAHRRLIETLDETRARVSKLDVGLLQLVDETDSALVAAVERRDSAPQPTIGEAIGSALQRIVDIQANDGRVGVGCAISDIDNLLGGFDAGQVIVLAGRPGMGKTAVACAIAKGVAQDGHGVLFVSLEMKADELGQRVLSDMCYTGRHGIPFDRIVSATVNQNELRHLYRVKADADVLPLRIVDAGMVTMPRLALSVRRYKRKFAAQGKALKVVVIDYLQLLHASKNAKTRNDQVAEISMGLKALAKDANVCVVALAQLNRGVEGREDKRPSLADLRDSGQIEQDADAVMFLYREEYYLSHKKPRKEADLPAWHEAMGQVRDRIELILAKRRNGRTGSSTGYYFSEYQAVRGSDDRQEGFGL